MKKNASNNFRGKKNNSYKSYKDNKKVKEVFCVVCTLEILTAPDLIKCKRNLVARYSGTA
jgi:hypothetical protein